VASVPRSDRNSQIAHGQLVEKAIKIIEDMKRDPATIWQAEAYGWLAVALAPRDRRSFGERCRFWAHLVERTHIDAEGSGVLAELRHGYRVD